MKRIRSNLAAAMALGLAAFAADGQAEDLTPPSQNTGDMSVPYQPQVQTEAQRAVSASRINDRADWDVDYPSQLAPQAVTASGATAAAAGSLPSSDTER